MNISFIIIASLPIKGMKTVGNVGLLTYNKTTILDKHISNIKEKYPKSEIVVVGGFEAKKIKKIISKYKNIKFIQHKITDRSNEVESFYKALSQIKYNKAVVFNVATIFSKILLSKLNLKHKNSCVILNTNKDFNSNLGAIINKDKKIENIFYNLPNKIANIYYLTNDHIDYAKSIESDILYNKYVFELINLLNAHQKFSYQNVNLKNHRIITNIRDYQHIKDV